MELDLSKLNKLAFVSVLNSPEHTEQPQEQPKHKEVYKDTTAKQKAPQDKIKEISGAGVLQREADQKQDELKRAKDVYSRYQENIKLSSNLQTEILKGLKAGESVYNLFLKASKAISLMTDNTLFYKQAEEDIRAIYGEGLLEAPPLQKEIEQIEQRLTRLQQSAERELSGDSKQRINNAIKAHEAKITELQGLINT